MFRRITRRELGKILMKHPTDLIALVCTILLFLVAEHGFKLDELLEDIEKVVKEDIDKNY